MILSLLLLWILMDVGFITWRISYVKKRMAGKKAMSPLPPLHGLATSAPFCVVVLTELGLYKSDSLHRAIQEIIFITCLFVCGAISLGVYFQITNRIEKKLCNTTY
ncbi:MAG: hypothetical protein KDC26_04310 [Armatimonadetes bacterium]|nr:hypothetical protein [Armatimonadota bacterium]